MMVITPSLHINSRISATEHVRHERSLYHIYQHRVLSIQNSSRSLHHHKLCADKVSAILNAFVFHTRFINHSSVYCHFFVIFTERLKMLQYKKNIYIYKCKLNNYDSKYAKQGSNSWLNATEHTVKKYNFETSCKICACEGSA